MHFINPITKIYREPFAVQQFARVLRSKNFEDLIGSKTKEDLEKNAKLLAEKILKGNDTLTIPRFNEFLHFVEQSIGKIEFIAKSLIPSYKALKKSLENNPPNENDLADLEYRKALESRLKSFKRLFDSLKSLGRRFPGLK